MRRLIPYAGAEPALLRQRERERHRRRIERKAAPVQRLVVLPPSASPHLPVGIWEIFSEVADKHDITIEHIRGSSRERKYINARFEVAYRLKTERRISYPLIAKYLGYQDHSTAFHAVRTHAERNGLPEPCA